MTGLADVQLGYVETFEDIQEFLRWLGQRRPVLAMDTETAGLNPWDHDARIRLVQFGDANTGWTVPWHLWPGLVLEVLRKYRGRVTWHNIGYDAKYGTVVEQEIFKVLLENWSRMDDTYIMSRLAEPHKSAALKRLSDQIVDKTASLGQVMLKQAMSDNKWTWNTVPLEFETYTLYGAMDTVLGARVWEHFQPWVQAHSEVYELEMAVRRICTGMELRGFRIDLDYSLTKKIELENYVEECITWARTEYDCGIGSPMQLGRWFTDRGAHIDKFTMTGKPSVDKDVLKKLAIENEDPVVKQMAEVALKARKAEKLAGTYFANFLRFERDGVVHPNINTLAAKTSRMSITEPALQTLNKKEATVRDAMIAFDDEVLITCDSDQIESRLFANFSQDAQFQHAFDSGDFFVNLARRVYDDPTLMKADKRRDTIKTYWYAKLYGAGIAKMALAAGVHQSVMQAVDEAMNIEYPGIRKFQDRVINWAAREGKIVTPTGRELYIEDPSKAYVAVNYLLQGHAAECLKMALVNMDNSGIGGYLLCPVHDEVVASVPKDEAEDVAKVMEECMHFEDPELYPVPLTASAEGPYERWGDKIRAAA